MVQSIQGAGSEQPLGGAIAGVLRQQPAKTGNIDMMPKTEAYIRTEYYLKGRAELCSMNPELQRVMDNVEYTIDSNGSVYFTFKGNVNVEQFKQAFGLSDGFLRSYLKQRHNEGMNNGSVHAIPAGDATSDHEVLTNYELGGLGATIRYTDGYAMTKQHRGGWINRDKIVDCPDYRGMSLGPGDNERLHGFDLSCFNH